VRQIGVLDIVRLLFGAVHGHFPPAANQCKIAPSAAVLRFEICSTIYTGVQHEYKMAH